jgi:hypothetical protein
MEGLSEVARGYALIEGWGGLTVFPFEWYRPIVLDEKRGL